MAARELDGCEMVECKIITVEKRWTNMFEVVYF